MSKERENNEHWFDNLRKYGRYFSLGLLGLGALIGSSALLGAAMADIAMDQTVGKEISNKLKKKQK